MKVFFGGVVGRYYEPDHVQARDGLVFKYPQIVTKYRPGFQDALLSRARSRNAQVFLESDCDVHLSVDSDIVFLPEDALRICDLSMTHDVVGGQYITRVKGGRYCFPTSKIPDGARVLYAGEHVPVAAEYVSGGFVATHRRVFEKLAERPDMPMLHEKDVNLRFRPFYMPMIVPGDGETLYLSEDWAFCERARQEGFGVWIDPGVRLLHVGPHGFRLEDMLDDPRPQTPMWLTRQPGGAYQRDIPREEDLADVS